MSKIHNIGLNLEHKIANPFKTSRNITTPNPFRNSNFEGNSLPFADVFEGFEPKKVNKFKMIASSVAGSMTKLHSSITEPIARFVSRIKNGVSNAWDYAKNTNISDIKGLRTISRVLNTPIELKVPNFGKKISNSFSGISHNFSEKFSNMNQGVLDIRNDLSSKWNSMISNINKNRITKDTSVSDLRSMWENEIKAMSKSEVA